MLRYRNNLVSGQKPKQGNNDLAIVGKLRKNKNNKTNTPNLFANSNNVSTEAQVRMKLCVFWPYEIILQCKIG